MPPHLQLTLLNVPPALDAQAVLPRPQHVILNHLYCQRGQVCVGRTAWMTGLPLCYPVRLIVYQRYFVGSQVELHGTFHFTD